MEKPKPLERTSYFDITRQFLANFVFLNAENLPSLVRFEESSKLRRNLDAIDKINEYDLFYFSLVIFFLFCNFM